MPKHQKKILSVKIRHMIDGDPDASYLGKYTDKSQDNAIICVGEHRGRFVSDLSDDEILPDKCGRTTYCFFVPAMTGEQTGNPNSPIEDFERMAALNNGDWYYIGIRAEAEVGISTNGKEWKLDRLISRGLWGIESDSEESFFKEVESDELNDLRETLSAYGFTKKQIKEAFQNVGQKE